LHALLQVRVLAGVEASWSRPKREFASGVHESPGGGPASSVHPGERLRPDLPEQSKPSCLPTAAPRDRQCWLPIPLGGPQAADYGVPQAPTQDFLWSARRKALGYQSCQNPHMKAVGTAYQRGGGQPHVTAGEALSGLSTSPEPEEAVRGSWGHLLKDIPPGITTCSTRRGVVIPSRPSSGAAGTGPSCSSSIPIVLLRLSRHTPARTSVRFTGTIAACGCPTAAVSLPSPMTSSW